MGRIEYAPHAPRAGAPTRACGGISKPTRYGPWNSRARCGFPPASPSPTHPTLCPCPFSHPSVRPREKHGDIVGSVRAASDGNAPAPAPSFPRLMLPALSTGRARSRPPGRAALPPVPQSAAGCAGALPVGLLEVPEERLRGQVALIDHLRARARRDALSRCSPPLCLEHPTSHRRKSARACFDVRNAREQKHQRWCNICAE